MEVAIAGLKTKIMEMYPEIDKYGVVSSLIFDNSKKTYVFKLTKGPHELSTYIDQVDADACMGGKECIHLGIQIRQFLENFKEGEKYRIIKYLKKGWRPRPPHAAPYLQAKDAPGGRC